jgi:hypothetical protein
MEERVMIVRRSFYTLAAACGALLLLSACNIGGLRGSKGTDQIQPLFDAARLSDKGADAIDKELGAPTSVDQQRNREYSLRDGSNVTFTINQSGRLVQIALILKSRAETPQQALKYAGIEVGDIPSSSKQADQEVWEDVLIEGRHLHLGVVKSNNNWGMVRIVPKVT